MSTTCQPGSTEAKNSLVIGLIGAALKIVPLDECQTIEQVTPWLRVIRGEGVLGAVLLTMHGRAAFDGDDWTSRMESTVVAYQVPLGTADGSTGFIVDADGGGYAIRWVTRDDSSRIVNEETMNHYETVREAFEASRGAEWLTPSAFTAEAVR